MAVEHRIDLGCHPSAPTKTVRAIQVLVRRRLSAELEMTFRLDGDIPRIQIPPIGVPRFARDLWRHTCFETFIAVDGQPTYHKDGFAGWVRTYDRYGNVTDENYVDAAGKPIVSASSSLRTTIWHARKNGRRSPKRHSALTAIADATAIAV